MVMLGDKNMSTKKQTKLYQPRAAAETFNAEPATDEEILTAITALARRLSKEEAGITIRCAVQDVRDRLNGKL
jgi:hypothetical protein